MSTTTDIQKNILTTIAYYDGMDYPMTALEIWKYLMNIQSSLEEKFSLAKVTDVLDSYNARRFIEEYHGFYFLRGRSDLVEKRIKHGKISTSKIKKLRRVVWLLRFCPFVQMIAVTGGLAMKNADTKSDWDVLAVLKNGRIWTGRTLVTALAQLLGKRRHGLKIRNRICLNFFITDKSLQIPTRDIFSAHEYFFMFPIFDAGVFRKFQLENRWIRDYKPNFYLNEAENSKNLRSTRIASLMRETGERILNFDFLEHWLKGWQSKRIIRDPRTKKGGSFVRISDDSLIFLPEPHGPKLLELLERKIEKMKAVGY
jgi:hypothetical protein